MTVHDINVLYCDVTEECTHPPLHPGLCSNLYPGWIPIPDQPYNEIADGLYQGGSHRTPYREEFDAVFTLYRSAPAPEDGIRHKQWNIPDSGLPDLDELDAAVAWVRAQWLLDRRVLVRCQAGLNRSGLVVARVLIDSGAEPAETIRLIRKRRSPFALCNNNFEAYLRSLEGQDDE